MQRARQSHLATVENLPERLLMTGVALGISEVTINGGAQLRITGTAGNDQITVTQTSHGLVVGNTGGWTKTVNDPVKTLWVSGGMGNNAINVDASVTLNATLIGGSGNDSIVAGSGNNSLFGGAGKNVLQSRSGNDTLVTLGSTADTIIAGSGNDSFWTDNNPAEKIQNLSPQQSASGAVHRVSNYYNANSIVTNKSKGVITGVSIKEPTVDPGVSYSAIATGPVFSNTGPSENDIFQGDLSDCYYLSVLSSTAKIDPNRLRQSILDMGDGTVVVQLFKNGKPIFVHEDELLPSSGGSAYYAGLGTQNSSWAPLMEKAFAYVRTARASYASLNSGWMDEAYQAIGSSNVKSIYSFNSPSTLLTTIKQALAAGQSVTYATAATVSGNGLIAGHAYTVDSVGLDGTGNAVSITLRNPWGCNADGTGNGYVTLTGSAALKALGGITCANV